MTTCCPAREREVLVSPEEVVASSGNAAWMLMAASLVLLMTPGVAFFYGGMSRSKSVLNMMMMSFGSMAVIGVIYVLWGWSMSYGTEDIGGVFANPFEFFGLKDSITDADGNFIAGRMGLPECHRYRVPGDVRDHHHRAHQRRTGRARQVRHVDGVLRDLGDGGLLPAGTHGVGRRAALRLRERTGRQDLRNHGRR